MLPTVMEPHCIFGQETLADMVLGYVSLQRAQVQIGLPLWDFEVDPTSAEGWKQTVQEMSKHLRLPVRGSLD